MKTENGRSYWRKDAIFVLVTLAIIFALGVALVLVFTPLDQISLSLILTEIVTIAVDLAYCLAVLAAIIGTVVLVAVILILIGRGTTKMAKLFRRGK